MQPLVINFNRNLAGVGEGKPLTNRSKNKCKGFLTLFSILLYSSNEGKRTVGFKLHFSLQLIFRSQEHIYTMGGLRNEQVLTDAMMTFTSIVPGCCEREITHHHQYLFKLLITRLAVQRLNAFFFPAKVQPFLL